MEYFCKIKGKHSGPFDVSELNDMLKSGLIGPKTKIFNSAVKNWVPIATVEGIDQSLTVMPSGKSATMAIALGVSVILLVAGGVFFLRGKGKKPAHSLKEAGDQYRAATSVVVIVSAEKRFPMATAFAVAPHIFGTNGHVVDEVDKAVKLGNSCYIVTHAGKKTYKVIRTVKHPKYSQSSQQELNSVGKRPSVPVYDVGLLEIEGQHDITFPIAEKEDYLALGPGMSIAYLGYPMEGLAGGNIAIESPLSIMQTGVISSVSDFYFADGGREKNLLIRHNLPATGGASGSPIFNEKGHVVGLLNGGNVSLQVSANGHMQRQASAALINFGMRVDLLEELLDQAYPTWRKKP